MLWFPLKEDLWDYMAVTGAIYFTGAFALLVGGLYWKRASRTGAAAALLAGCSSVLGLGPVQEILGVDWRGDIVGLCAAGGALVALVLGSLLVPDAPEAETPRTGEAV